MRMVKITFSTFSSPSPYE